MGDELFSIFNEFLSDSSMMRVINLPLWDIIQEINPKIASSIEDAKTEGNATRLQRLLSIQDVLIKQTKEPYSNKLLHVVAKDGSVETAMQLLKFGANVNARNYDLKSPMFYAIRNSAEMVKVLLDNGKFDDRDLFYEALLFGTEEIFELLVNERLLKIQNNLAQDAISAAICKFKQNKKTEQGTSCRFDEFQKIINTFLQHKLHLENMGHFYPILIFFAAKISMKDLLQIILDDCRKKLPTFMSNFEYFVDNERYELLAPEELNVRGYRGQTALHNAVIHQHIEVAQLLLEKGADPNCHDIDNITPLHFASHLGNEEMCRLLLSFGANVNPNFDKLLNPLNLICSKREEPFLNILNVAMKDFSERETVFNHKIIKLLLEYGADPNSLNGNVPILFNVCQLGFVEGVKILLEYGANVHTLDNESASALHYAVCGSSLEVVDLLLGRGLDIDLKNNIDETPLLAAIGCNGTNAGMIEYLVDRGANINALNICGETALHMAVGCNAYDIEFLLELGADWLISNIGEYIILDVNRPLKQPQKVLISFIALTETELRNHIKFYVGNAAEKLRQAHEYFQESKLEITKLKMTTISEEIKISYFDFLTKDFYSSVQIAKNLDLKKFFNSDDYENEFPCYKSLLKFRVEMTKNLEDSVDKTFDFMLNYTNLHPEIVEMILSNLRTIDFRVFGRVLSNKRF